MSLSKKLESKIAKQAKLVKGEDLYNALHHVGDDPTKGEIEDVLKDMLDDETFRRVVAVFVLCTKY